MGGKRDDGVGRRWFGKTVMGSVMGAGLVSRFPTVRAQSGEVTGKISTEGGNPLEGADVRLVNISTGAVEGTTVSNSNGDYSFTSVEPGAYRVEAEFRGGRDVRDIMVREGERLNVDLLGSSIPAGSTAGPAGATATRPAGPYFTLSVDGTNSPVTAGEDTRVDVTVTNRQENSGSHAVRLEIPDVGEDAEPVALDGDTSRNVSLSVPTDIGDAGEYTAQVSTNDDTAQVRFVVEEIGTDMDVSISDTNSPVTAGEDTRIDVTVTNRQGNSGSQEVRVEIPDIGEDAELVALDGDSSRNVSLSVPTDIGDAGEYTAQVSTNDDTAEVEFVVEEIGTDMDVSISDTNSPVTEGETLTVETRFSNPSDSPASGTATAEVDRVGSDTGRFSVVGGGEVAQSFEIPTGSGDAGDYRVTVSVGDSIIDSMEVSIQERGVGNTTGGGSGWRYILYTLGALGLVGGGYGGYRILGSSSGEDDWKEDEEYSSHATRQDTDRQSYSKAERELESETSRETSEIPRAPAASFTYEDIEKIEAVGSGGNADVYRAVADTPRGEIEFALKEPRMSGTLHSETAERLMQEAETWDRLDDHDHIVGVIDYDSEPLPWIAMEYMDTGHLGERAGEMRTGSAVQTAIATTEAVRHAHRLGVAHLDLKPENVLFRSTGEDTWDVPKVADWGLSKHLLNHSKSVEGLSPQYSAPEQFDDDYGSADDITDIYQLGAVFYELFTGEPPFHGKPAKVMNKVMNEEPTPPSRIADVPTELDDILLTAMAKDKTQRYESVLYLRDGLQNLYESV